MQSHIQTLIRDNKHLREKVDDLENRSRRNNLRILGLPEDIPQQELANICEKEIPELLRLPASCKVERAHRLGPDLRSAKRDTNPNVSRTAEKPRQVIVKYLDYADKTNILRTFRALKNNLTLRGHKLLIFGDFSAEVTQKRRAFSAVCTSLYRKQIRFADSICRFPSERTEEPQSVRDGWMTSRRRQDQISCWDFAWWS